jgi:hypothetical protein
MPIDHATYSWALLNGACDTETQAEFDALDILPIDKARDAYKLWAQAERRANFESIYS